jgi:hypothetical protein
MALSVGFKKYVVFPVVAVFRYIYTTGQSIYPYVKFGKYAFGRIGHPVTTVLISAAVTANLGTNSLVKLPALHRELTEQPDPHPIEALNLRRSGKAISGLFKVSGGGMISLEFISGDFGTMVIIDSLGELIGVNFHGNIYGVLGSQLFSFMGGAASAKIFHSYEYAFVGKRNAQRMGWLFQDGHYLEKIRKNKLPFTMTCGLTGLTMAIYFQVALFWTKSAVDDFADQTGMLNDTAKALICFLAVFFTIVFTLGWAPTHFDTFKGMQAAPGNDDAESKQLARVRHPKSCQTKSMIGLAAFCLPKDSLTWAVTTFMAVVTNGEEFLGANPYGAIAGLGAFCALVAGGFYGMSLLPGLRKTLAGNAVLPAQQERLLEAGLVSDDYRVEVLPDDLVVSRDSVSAKALVSGGVNTLLNQSQGGLERAADSVDMSPRNKVDCHA